MRINWHAVAIHCMAAAITCTVAAAISAAINGVPLLGALPAWLAVSVFYIVRESITAANRHNTGSIREGWKIVLEGEAGWSRWNLRLQAFAPAVAGWGVVLIAWRL